MLHLLYLLAFSGLAALAIGNLIRNLMILGTESQRNGAVMPSRQGEIGNGQRSVVENMSSSSSQRTMNLHPEMLDKNGRPIREPLLVMKSMTVDDARDHLDALFQASPESSSDSE
ncbi:MAG: DUF2973 domain-containing protein [Cyanobacteria bacterium P01_C01_bin.89]